MDVFESVAINDRCRRGLHMRDKMRSGLASRRRRALL
jgi:hypothetical protein